MNCDRSRPRDLLFKAKLAYASGDEKRARAILSTIERNFSPATFFKYNQVFNNWIQNRK